MNRLRVTLFIQLLAEVVDQRVDAERDLDYGDVSWRNRELVILPCDGAAWYLEVLLLQTLDHDAIRYHGDEAATIV